MIQRCEYDKSINFSRYGARGISVCASWRTSFKEFSEWAAQSGYSENLSIDRIDVNGNYTPENCRWANAKGQANNRSNSRLIEHDGLRLSASEWSALCGVPTSTIMYRINSGKSPKEALVK